MWTAIAAIIIFSLLIFIHELGHFLAAKSFGVLVHEFAIGMGPAIFKKQGKETLYSVRCLPIGGFCKLEGEDENSDNERAINRLAKWKRIVVMAAGSIMNLLLGLIVCIIALSTSPLIELPIMDQIVPGSAAEEAGLLPNDRILKINNSTINLFADVQLELFITRDKPIDLVIDRNGEKIEKNVTPKPIEQNGRTSYLIGFSPKYVSNNFILTVEHSFYQTILIAKSTYYGLGMLVSGQGGENISGPVGIVNTIGEAVDATSEDFVNGLYTLIGLFMMITINLGVVNLLPLPALDGGRIVFVLVEAIIRRPIPPEKEGLVHAIGFMLLIGLMLFATYNDIVRIFFKG